MSDVLRRAVFGCNLDVTNRFAAAAAEAKRVVRRAGAPWNKHDDAALRGALRAAVDLELPCVHTEYGGLRFRFDMVRGGRAVLADAQLDAGGGGGGQPADVELQERRPATAGPPAPVGAARQAAPASAGHASATRVDSTAAAAAVEDGMEVELDDELSRLRRKETARRDAKKRHRQNQRRRKAESAADAAAATAAAAAAAPTPTAFAFGGGPPPGLSPTASPFVFGAASSGSALPSTSGGAGAAAAAGGGSERARERRVICPALARGSGDLKLVQAQAALLERITESNCAMSRSAESRGVARSVVPRTCIFPEQDATIGRRQVMLMQGSLGARMSETELGAALALSLNAQLSDERLRQLISQLAQRAGG